MQELKCFSRAIFTANRGRGCKQLLLMSQDSQSITLTLLLAKSTCKVPEEVTEDWYFNEFQSRNNYCYSHKLSLLQRTEPHKFKKQRPPYTNLALLLFFVWQPLPLKAAHLGTLNMKLLTLINNISAKTLESPNSLPFTKTSLCSRKAHKICHLLKTFGLYLITQKSVP